MIGEIYDVVYGLDEGNYLEVVSEPYNMGHNSSKYVKVKDQDGNYFDIRVEELFSMYYELRSNDE